MGSCFRSTVLKTAASYVGYKEGPNNYNIFGQHLSKLGYFNGDKTNVEWCGSYCYDVILRSCFGDDPDYDDYDAKWDTLRMTGQPARDNCACACRYGASYFRAKGWWSTKKARPGDIVFYGTSGSEKHQGILATEITNGHFYAYEGNHNNQVAKVYRSMSEVAGFGLVDYDEEPEIEPVPEPQVEVYKGPWPKLPDRGYFQRYDVGGEVMKMQGVLEWVLPGCLPKYGCDGEIGSETLQAVKSVQKIVGTTVDGFYGRKTDTACRNYRRYRND